MTRPEALVHRPRLAGDRCWCVIHLVGEGEVRWTRVGKR